MAPRAAEARHAGAILEDLRRALGIRRPVRALESADASMPLTWGILRPAVLLPEGSREWPPARLRTVMAARQLRKERERACDDAVLSRRAAIAIASAALAVLLPVAAITAQAQAARGSVVGVVQDPSGAHVPNCQVTARNLDGPNQEVTRANAAGEYRFTALPPGRYALEIRSAGFAIFKAEVAVEAGKAARVDAALSIGQVSETVVVKGQKPAAVPPMTQPMAGAPQRIRVGGNVQATKLISMAKPEYPAELQQLGIEGAVVMRAIISKTGELLHLEAISTDVDARLVKAALDAVRTWKYQPTLLNGQPVEVVTTITIDFQLGQ